MFAIALTGVQWIFVLAGGAAVLYILYKLLPTFIAALKNKISGPQDHDPR